MRSRAGSTRIVGLVVALLCAIATLGLMAWFVFGPRGEAAREAARREAMANDAPPDITSLDAAKDGGRGREIHIQLVDKQRPGRVSSEVFLPSVEPLENRRYLVQRPEAWFYLQDGKSVHIRADRGNLRLPSRDALPESGLLEGGVLVRLFEPTVDGTRPQPGRDVPAIEARTETLQFDGTLGELTSPEALRVEGRGVSFLGSQMRAIFNEVDQQIELLTFQRVTQFTYNPKLASTLAPSTPAKAASQTAGNAAPSKSGPTAAATAEPRVATAPNNAPNVTGGASTPAQATTKSRSTLYRAYAVGDVILTQGKRDGRGSALELFALVTDGRLPTIKSPNGAKGTTAADATSLPVAASTPAHGTEKGASGAAAAAPSLATSQPAPGPPTASAASAPATLSSAGSDEIVTLQFTGPLEIKALAKRPETLGTSDLALAFVGDSSSRASVHDGVDGNSALAERITYFADQQIAALSAATEGGVEMLSPASGTAVAKDVRVDLAGGHARFVGPGRLRTGDKSIGDARGELAWRDGADFSFVVRDGKMTSLLTQATLQGSVLAKSEAGELKARTIVAELTPGEARSRLSSLTLTGDAKAADTRGGSLQGQSIVVQFLDQSDAVIPTSAIAIGSVVATRDTSRLVADELEATFFTTPADKGKVDRVIAKNNVRFTGADGVAASCDLLTAYANDQLADLEGQMVTLSQAREASREFAAVTGTKMKLEGQTGRLTVFGPGVFRQEGPLSNAADAPREIKAIARWTQGMTYDDATGQLDASGATEAQAFSSPLAYDELKSQSIRLTLTKGSAPAQSAGGGLGLLTQPLPPQNAAATERKQLLTATAIGTTGGAPASVTSRRFAVGTPREAFATTQPEMLMYLQGATIVADNAAGTLNVPGEGKLLIVDRRPEAGKPAANAPTSDSLAGMVGGSGSSRGNSLFDWKGSLSVARASNTLTMSKSVRLIHTPLDAAQLPAELECETLTAQIGEADAKAGDATLRKVDAEGSVFAKSGKREVVADAISYDALARRMEAWSKGVNMVTATDPASATPVTAQALTWDLASDRIEIRKPGTIVAPR